MTISVGTAFIFKIFNGTTYDIIGACKTHSVNGSTQIVDSSSKDSVWETSIDGVGKKSLTIGLTGLARNVSANAGYEALKDLFFNATASQKQMELVLANGEKITGVFDLTEFSFDAPDAGAVEFSASLKLSGQPTIATV
jgi:predicted secreted protein